MKISGLLLLGCLAGPAFAQRVITTAAGTRATGIADGTAALDAAIGPIGVAYDTAGNFYFTSPDTNRVFKVDTQGKISLVAGNGFGTFSGDGGRAVNASLWAPTAVAVDGQGNVYITDSRNNRVRKVDAGGTVTTLAGTGTIGYSDANGIATSATLYNPQWIAVDSAGNVYFSDLATVRKVDGAGKISRVAGNGAAPDPTTTNDGAPAASSPIGPSGVAVDSAGNVFITEPSFNRIRRVDAATGLLSTVAGTGSAGFSGDGGPAVSATMYFPAGLALDAAGNLYIAVYGNQRIRKVDTNGIITSLDSPFAALWDVAVDGNGNLLATDYGSARIQKIDANGVTTTAAGSGRRTPPDDGVPALQAYITPFGLAFDGQGNLIIADQNNLVKRLNTDGTVSTIAGNGRAGNSGDGGRAVAASFNGPYGVAVDANGNVFVSDSGNSAIRKITPDGIVAPFVNTGLIHPQGIAFDRTGNLFVADSDNNRIVKIDPSGAVTAVAGSGAQGYSGDGGPALSATLNKPGAVAFDKAGNLLIADTYNNTIRRVDSSGKIATIAGGGALANVPDGAAATSVRLFWPGGMAVDGNGTLYFTDTHNSRVFQLPGDGTLVNIAGTGAMGFTGDGGLAVNAALTLCFGVAVDGAGNVFIADLYNNAIREVVAAAPPVTVSGNGGLNFSATSNGAVAQSQAVALSAGLDGGVFTASVATSDGANWLKLDTARGHAPANLHLSADPTGLAPGTYQGSLSIQMPGFAPAVTTVNVAFLVTPTANPQLTVQPGAISFTATQQSAPGSQVVFVNNSNGSAPFDASAVTDGGGNWLKVSNLNGMASPLQPGSVTVAADASGLPPGAYSGSLILTANGANTRVPVALNVTSQNRAHILTSQTALAFTASSTGGGALPQQFGILNTGSGTMNWTATASAQGNWLSVASQTNVSVSNSLRVPLATAQVNAAGLAPGTYKGSIAVASPDADNSPQTMNVVLQVLDKNQTLGPVVRPTGLIFTTGQGAPPPGSQPTTIYNFSTQTYNYSATSTSLSGGDWLQISSGSGKVESALKSGFAQLAGQVNSQQLAGGVYDGGISILFGNNNFQFVSALLVVVPQGAVAGKVHRAGANDEGAPAASCQATQLRIVFTNDQDNFTAPVGVPFPIGLGVVDDCGNPMRNGSVVASFTNGDAAISLVSLKNGQWDGTWVPQTRQAGQTGLQVQAQSPDGLFGSAYLRGVLQ